MSEASSAPKRWEDLRGCERIVRGAQANLHFVATACFVILLCSLAGAVEYSAPSLGIPLKLAFIALVVGGVYYLWTSALSLTERPADRASARAGSGGEEDAAANLAAKERAAAEQKRKEEELLAMWDSGGKESSKPSAPSTPGRGGKGKKA
jgi:hypothetical protein